MPLIALQLKANMVNLTELQPAGDWTKFRWHLKFKCTNCGEESKNWKYITEKDRYEVSGNRGTANLFEKCKLCARMNSVEIVKDSLQPYTDIGNFETLVKFDCRGLEPIAFEPRIGWKAVSTKSSLVFEDVDLIDKEWVDYDEKAAEPVEISEMDCRFVLCRKE